MARRGSTKQRTLSKNELYQAVVHVFRKNPEARLDYKQLASGLEVKDMGTKQRIHELLLGLEKEGRLVQVGPGKFKWNTSKMYVVGTIEVTARGNAYVASERRGEDIFIPQGALKHALDGDKVKVLVAPGRKRRSEGEVVEVLERKKDTFVGIVQQAGQYAFLIPAGKQLPCDIFIPREGLHGAKHGEKAIVKITKWTEDQRNPEGEVVEVLGMQGDNDTEMHAILAEFELPVAFPEAVEQAAREIPETIPVEEYRKRKDFREVVTFTIDPKDAKDFDDALSIRMLPGGNYEVGVHIADVSYYVPPDSVLDKEAYARATSVYLVDRTIPMLPERLSNGLCSLRPNEEKLCFSAVFELNREAEVLQQWFGRTVICSNRRFTYEEAQAIIEGAEGDFKQEILVLNALARQLREARFQNGSIDFDRVEVKFDLDEQGRPLGVYFKEAKEANKLIEEFMLLANKKVAERVGKLKAGQQAKTFVYRVHEQPNQEKLADFERFIAKFGYRIRTSTPRTLSTSMNSLMGEIKHRPEQNMIETLAVRTMAKAVYSTENIGHYGLAFDYYSHFTSPIRRYPDVMTHRLLQRYLDGGRSANPKAYEERCKHCSNMEQVAANAERASIKYKQVEFMADKVGQTFLGTISGVTQWGFYVELNDTKCEGLVSIFELEGDRYEFDEENYCIVGRYHRKVYQLGDQVMIQVAKANLVARQLDFLLADSHENKPSLASRRGRQSSRPVSPKEERRRGRRGTAPVAKKGEKRKGRR